MHCCLAKGKPLAYLLSLATVALLIGQATAQTGCPWQKKKSSLVRWSDQPWAKNQKVTINNQRVLLDQSVDLTTLTINNGAALIWADKDNITLSAEYILVLGEFHIGSETCKFQRRAHIRLKGRFNSPHTFETHRKFLGVGKGGVLEIHGMKKTPWTRLARGIKPLHQLPCAVVFDVSNETQNPFYNDRGSSGLHVIIWDKQAEIYDYNLFSKTDTNFAEFVDNIPDGYIIGMYSMQHTLIPSAKDIAVVKELGGSQFSSIKSAADFYSFLAKKGAPGKTREFYSKSSGASGAVLRLRDSGFDFQVSAKPKSKDRKNFFMVFHEDASYPLLELAKKVEGWVVGSQIVVTSTDYDWTQAELREIVECPECSKSQIRVNAPFTYGHYGNFTQHVDERAEVGMMTRNILIEGVMLEDCKTEKNSRAKLLCDRFKQDTYGGQTRVMKGFKEAHIEGVELYHMGQQYAPGAYPLHYHMVGNVPGSWVKENTIHHSFSRCVTIHGTDDLLVKDNVCYDHLGHGFFLEDSVEQNNTLDGNLGLGTKYGSLLMSDSDREWCKQDYTNLPRGFEISCGDLSTFWLTHPNNYIRNNVAAGGERHGYMYVFAELPLTISLEEQEKRKTVKNHTVKNYPIKQFYNNVAHSNKLDGIFMDSHISTGKIPEQEEGGIPENGIIQNQNNYDPRDPPGDPNGTRVWTKMERVTVYRNAYKNLWIKGGNIRLLHFSIADSPEGMTGGTTGTETGTSLEKSVIIGKTDNLGNPRPYTYQIGRGKKAIKLKHDFKRSYATSPFRSVTGISTYQGPMYVKHSFFDRFETVYWNDTWTKHLDGKRPASYGGAISFKRDSTYPTMTSQYVTNVSFGYCEDENKHWVFFGNSSLYDWEDKDGTRAAHNLDKDGSVTGTPNTYIVRDNPFFTGDECLFRRDWNMNMCPYRYIKMEVLGTGGHLDNSFKTKYPLLISRDDHHEHHFLQSAQIRREFLLRTHKSFFVNFNTSLKGATKFPSKIEVIGKGVESQDVVRVGFCVPKDAKISVFMDYPVVVDGSNYKEASDLSDLDNRNDGAFFHDKINGAIFFKIWSRHDRTNDSQMCPDGKCFALKILIDSQNNDVRKCFQNGPPQEYSGKMPVKPKEIKQYPCSKFKLGSPQGLGAILWDKVGKIVHQDLNVPCLSRKPTDASDVADLGCYRLYDELKVKLKLQQSLNGMTRNWCKVRCARRKYKFAAVGSSKICSCLEAQPSDAHKQSGCSKDCTGNSSQKCGDSTRVNVMETGL